MRKSFAILCADDTPMVRRAAARALDVRSFIYFYTQNLHVSQSFVKKLSRAHVLSSILPVYKKLATDDQDSVRLLTVQDLIAISQQLGPEDVKSHLLVQLRSSVSDKSWRVRYMVANHFVEVTVD